MKKYTRTKTYEFIQVHPDGSVVLRIEGEKQTIVVPKGVFEKDFKEVKVAKLGK